MIDIKDADTGGKGITLLNPLHIVSIETAGDKDRWVVMVTTSFGKTYEEEFKTSQQARRRARKLEAMVDQQQ